MIATTVNTGLLAGTTPAACGRTPSGSSSNDQTHLTVVRNYLHFEALAAAADAASSSTFVVAPSTAWSRQVVADLAEGLAGGKHHYVCQQLVSMVKEQQQRVVTAVSTADMDALHAASTVFLATLRESACAAAPVAAALFYPRPCQCCNSTTAKCSDPTLLQPGQCSSGHAGHLYIELLVCNRPGCGYGGALLERIEAFATIAAPALAGAIAAPHVDSVRLLSVEHAQSFYQRRGYNTCLCAPHELCKHLCLRPPLPPMSRAAPLGVPGADMSSALPSLAAVSV
jgi:hypothetical protein